MRCAFAQFTLFLDDLQIAKIAKLPLEHGAGIEVFPLLRATSTVLQLLRRIALDDQNSAGLQRAPHAAPLFRALRRRAELRKNFDHDVEGRLWIIPNVHVGANEGNLHTPVGGESMGLVLRSW